MKASLLTLGILLLASFFSFRAMADSQYINRKTIMEKSYKCSNGGTLTLLDTRYGNVKKVVFKKIGNLDEIGYVQFWSMLDSYTGSISAYKNFPDPKSGEDSYRSKTYADMEISFDGKGLQMTISPVRMSHGPGFTCQNY
ncbi:MAG: hypothetical protein HUU57_08660 [Bdellovibrio sp.]|nr:hypothetical protein [Bdellovibrio sp.]